MKVTKQGVLDLGGNSRPKKKDLPPLDGEIDPADMRDAARRFSEKKDRPNQSRRPNG